MSKWYLSVIPIVFIAVMRLWKCHIVNRTIYSLQGSIDSWSDLKLVRDAIDLCMIQPYFFYAVCIVMFVFGLYLVFNGDLKLIHFFLHFIIFFVFTLPLMSMGIGSEDELKNCPIHVTDPAIEITYTDYLKQWEKGGFRIKDRD